MTEAGSPFALPGSRPESLTLVTGVGAARGSRAAAAALACAGADPDRAGVLVELSERRPPRPGLLASSAARSLEERLAAHLPEAAVAASGFICRLTLPAAPASVRELGGLATIARELVVAVHVPPELLQTALEEPGMRASGALLRADLPGDRALAALLARDLLGRGLRVAVLKRPPGWVASRRALAGLLPPDAGGLPLRIRQRLLDLRGAP